MKKIVFLILLAFVAISCDKTESPIYDQNQTLVYFVENEVRLEVTQGVGGEVEIEVGASTLSNQDREVQIEFIGSTFEENENENFDFDNSVVIPAGEYTGSFTVSGVDTNLGADPELLEFSLLSTTAENTVLNSVDIEVSMRLICPIPDDFLVGEYMIEDVAGTVGPGNGTENFASGQITIETGPASTQRNFNVGVLPAFAGEFNVVLDLSCGLFVLEDVNVGLTCDQENSYIFTATTSDNASTYDLGGSDEEFIINYIEDPEGSCGGPFQSSFRLTKVN